MPRILFEPEPCYVLASHLVSTLQLQPQSRRQKGDKGGYYFLTITVVEWINIFTKPRYFELLRDSLQFCIDQKGLVLYEYVFMTNHIHLIARASEDSDGLALNRAYSGTGLDAIIRDFKRFTTQEIKKLLKEDNRSYILRVLKNSLKFKKGSEFQIWQRENYAEEIYSDEFRDTKVNYIHNNPVKKQYVLRPEDWLYSSARQKIQELEPDHPNVVLPCAKWEV